MVSHTQARHASNTGMQRTVTFAEKRGNANRTPQMPTASSARLSALIAENSALLQKLVGGEGRTAAGTPTTAQTQQRLRQPQPPPQRPRQTPAKSRRPADQPLAAMQNTPNNALNAEDVEPVMSSRRKDDLLDAYREKCTRLERAIDTNARLKARLLSRENMLTSLEPLKQRYDEVHASRVNAEKTAARLERRVNSLVQERDSLATRVDGGTRDEEVDALRDARDASEDEIKRLRRLLATMAERLTFAQEGQREAETRSRYHEVVAAEARRRQAMAELHSGSPMVDRTLQPGEVAGGRLGVDEEAQEIRNPAYGGSRRARYRDESRGTSMASSSNGDDEEDALFLGEGDALSRKASRLSMTSDAQQEAELAETIAELARQREQEQATKERRRRSTTVAMGDRSRAPSDRLAAVVNVARDREMSAVDPAEAELFMSINNEPKLADGEYRETVNPSYDEVSASDTPMLASSPLAPSLRQPPQEKPPEPPLPAPPPPPSQLPPPPVPPPISRPSVAEPTEVPQMATRASMSGDQTLAREERAPSTPAPALPPPTMPLAPATVARQSVAVSTSPAPPALLSDATTQTDSTANVPSTTADGMDERPVGPPSLPPSPPSDMSVLPKATTASADTQTQAAEPQPTPVVEQHTAATLPTPVQPSPSMRPPPPPQQAFDAAGAVKSSTAAPDTTSAYRMRTWAGVSSPPPASVAGATGRDIAAMHARLREITEHRMRALASLALEETELVAAEALEEERIREKLAHIQREQQQQQQQQQHQYGGGGGSYY
ncbi:hypothetical protein RI054_31g123550 [Pseudoscourfieldia marina]